MCNVRPIAGVASLQVRLERDGLQARVAERHRLVCTTLLHVLIRDYNLLDYFVAIRVRLGSLTFICKV